MIEKLPFNIRLKTIRASKNETQEQAAQQIPIDRKYFGQWEAGVVPAEQHRDAIARWAGIKRSILFKDVEGEKDAD